MDQKSNKSNIRIAKVVDKNNDKNDNNSNNNINSNGKKITKQEYL